MISIINHKYQRIVQNSHSPAKEKTIIVNWPVEFYINVFLKMLGYFRAWCGLRTVEQSTTTCGA